MIFGFAGMAIGYAVFYWGLHHFPCIDCPQCDPAKPGCRYSLWVLLGVDQIGKSGATLAAAQTGNQVSQGIQLS